MPTYFFKPPLNTSPVVLVDNRYDTGTTDLTQTVFIDENGDGSGAARPFSHIFLKSSGIASWSATGAGNTVSRTLPTELTDSSGFMVDPVIDGIHNDFFEWPGTPPFSARQLKFTFVAAGSTPSRLIQLLVLDLDTVIADNGFSDIQWGGRLPGFEQVSARNRGSIAPGIAGDRLKWTVRLVAPPKGRDRQDTVARAVSAFLSKYQNFVCAIEPRRYPEQVFRAYSPDRRLEIAYATRWKARGRRATWTIKEA